MLRFREKPGDIFELAQNSDRTGTIVIPVFPYVTRFSGIEVFGASLARDFICRFSEEEQKQIIQRRIEMGTIRPGSARFLDLSGFQSVRLHGVIFTSTVNCDGGEEFVEKYTPTMRKSYESAVRCAIDNNCPEVYFPVLGMGFNLWPAYDAIKIAEETLSDFSQKRNYKKVKADLVLVFRRVPKVDDFMDTELKLRREDYEAIADVYRQMTETWDKQAYDQEIIETYHYMHALKEEEERWAVPSDGIDLETTVNALIQEHLRKRNISQRDFFLGLGLQESFFKSEKHYRNYILAISIELRLSVDKTKELIMANDAKDFFPKRTTRDTRLAEIMQNNYVNSNGEEMSLEDVQEILGVRLLNRSQQER